MTAKEPITIQVTTQSLRRLLDDEPEVRIKLNAMACEKIGQEITEKARATDLSYARKALSEALAETTRKLSDQYRFPVEAQNYINTRIETAASHFVAQRLEAERKDFERRAISMMEDRLKKFEATMAASLAAFEAKFEGRIREQAHDEFLSVIREVKGAMV